MIGLNCDETPQCSLREKRCIRDSCILPDTPQIIGYIWEFAALLRSVSSPLLILYQCFMYHVYTMLCLYVICTFITCMLACSSWCMCDFLCHVSECFPSPSPPSASATTPLFFFYLYPASSCPCRHCACSKGVQALGSVKRLLTIILFWRYINTI